MYSPYRVRSLDVGIRALMRKFYIDIFCGRMLSYSPSQRYASIHLSTRVIALMRRLGIDDCCFPMVHIPVQSNEGRSNDCLFAVSLLEESLSVSLSCFIVSCILTRMLSGAPLSFCRRTGCKSCSVNMLSESKQICQTALFLLELAFFTGEGIAYALSPSS